MFPLPGQLRDPFAEFFVVADAKVRIEDLWSDMYHLNLDMLPSFIPLTQAKEILRAGKSINFIRLCCHEEDWLGGVDGAPVDHASGRAVMAGSAASGGGVVGGSARGMGTHDGSHHIGGGLDGLRKRFVPLIDSLKKYVMEQSATTNKRLVCLLLDKYSLLGHCAALKRYLLLAQGDFIEAFLELADADLRRDARKEVGEF